MNTITDHDREVLSFLEKLTNGRALAGNIACQLELEMLLPKHREVMIRKANPVIPPNAQVPPDLMPPPNPSGRQTEYPAFDPNIGSTVPRPFIQSVSQSADGTMRPMIDDQNATDYPNGSGAQPHPQNFAPDMIEAFRITVGVPERVQVALEVIKAHPAPGDLLTAAELVITEYLTAPKTPAKDPNF